VPRVDLQILVCTNERPSDAPRPCCAARGGLELYRRLKDELRSRGLRDRVLVTRTGCLRRCSLGTTVLAWPDERWHGGVEPEDAAELLDALLSGGSLERRPMPDGPWE